MALRIIDRDHLVLVEGRVWIWASTTSPQDESTDSSARRQKLFSAPKASRHGCKCRIHMAKETLPIGPSYGLANSGLTCWHHRRAPSSAFHLLGALPVQLP